MPSVRRRIIAALAVASLGVAGPATAALAQSGAGDQQYQDPFAGSSKPKTTPKPQSAPKTTTTAPPAGNLQPLSPSPQTAPHRAAAPGAAATPPATTAPSTARTLPNTGIDARVLLLAGVALLLTGFGLRLRFAPERF